MRQKDRQFGVGWSSSSCIIEKLCVAGSKTIKTDGTQLSDDERARLKAEWPEDFGQGKIIVRKMLRFIGRSECEDRKDADKDVFKSVRSFQ